MPLGEAIVYLGHPKPPVYMSYQLEQDAANMICIAVTVMGASLPCYSSNPQFPILSADIDRLKAELLCSAACSIE